MKDKKQVKPLKITTMKYETNYKIATEWLHNNYILCNKIADLDEDIFLYMDFDLEDGMEIFQYFITDCTQNDKEYLEEHFGLLFTYSPMLEKYILCVDHYGTSWDYVYCETDLIQATIGVR